MDRNFSHYEVLKVSDISKALNASEQRQLIELISKVTSYRQVEGKEPLECIVVESDWPEYNQVWNMIEDRVKAEAGQPTENRYAEGYADASRFFIKQGFTLAKGIDSYCTGWNTYMWSTKSEG